MVIDKCFIQFYNNIVEYNEFYNINSDTSDSGCIYAGQNFAKRGNIIRYNYFHDMSSDAEEQNIGIFAVYCDDNLGGGAIYGNIMYRCQSALLLHGGHDMIFSNNLIIVSLLLHDGPSVPYISKSFIIFYLLYLKVFLLQLDLGLF